MVKPLPFFSARKVYANAWPIWVALIALLYYPTYRTYPIFDDTAYVQWVIAYGASFLHHPESPVFRPFERLMIGLSWKMPGNGYWLAKTFSLTLLLIKTWLVAILGGMLFRDRRPLLRFAVPVLYLVHPMHVASVIKIDTISENLWSFWALVLTVLVAGLCFVPDEKLSNARVLRFALAASLISLLGMLSKEASLGIAASTPLLLSVAAIRQRQKSKAGFALLVSAGFTAVAMACYFCLRLLAGYSLTGGDPSARYKFHLGFNFLLNAAASIGASLFPGSTLNIFVHFNLFYVALAAGLVLTAIVLWLPQYIGFLRRTRSGIARVSPEARLLQVMAIAAFASLGPGGLISGLISENQSAGTIPFVLMLIVFIPAWMFDTDDPRRQSSRPAATMVLLAMMLVLMSTATSQKVEAAHEMSRRAYAMGDEMVKDYIAHPVGHYFLCIPPDSFTRGKYSIFSFSDGMLAAFQLYRIELLHPPKPANFIPGYSADLCSMQLLDERLSPATPTAAEAR